VEPCPDLNRGAPSSGRGGRTFASRAGQRAPSSTAGSEALDLESGQRRGAAWGFGGGARLATRISFFSVGFGLGLSANRPELLSILPSAVDALEIDLGWQLRFEN
jgi:hypothetical protein